MGNYTNDKLQEIKKKLYDQDECESLYENVGEQDLCTIGESGEDDCNVSLMWNNQLNYRIFYSYLIYFYSLDRYWQSDYC